MIKSCFRLTTPTSSVFVQRSFGHTKTAPVSERTLKRQIGRGKTAPVRKIEFKFNNTDKESSGGSTATESVLNSLNKAVDVLTRSSQGYMDVPEEDDNYLQDLQLESDIESLQKEIETLQQDIASLDEEEITYDLTNEVKNLFCLVE